MLEQEHRCSDVSSEEVQTCIEVTIMIAWGGLHNEKLYICDSHSNLSILYGDLPVFHDLHHILSITLGCCFSEIQPRSRLHTQ